MNNFSIPMALFDLLPVFFFMAGARTVAADMRQKMTLPARILFAGGSWTVCAAGLLKALSKLVCSLGLGDPAWMSGQFFYNQDFGFLLAGLGLTLAVTRFSRGQEKVIFLPAGPPHGPCGDDGGGTCRAGCFPLLYCSQEEKTQCTGPLYRQLFHVSGHGISLFEEL